MNCQNGQHTNYDFGSTEMVCYDGLNEVIDKLGTSISGGGANDYFELGFEDHANWGDDTKNLCSCIFKWFISNKHIKVILH